MYRQVIMHKFPCSWRRRLPCSAMCPAIFRDSGPRSLQYSFDFPGLLKNWLRVQEIASPAFMYLVKTFLFVVPGSSRRIVRLFWIIFLMRRFLRCFSINLSRNASFSCTWKVDAASSERGSILILLKVRIPTMRHVWRSHRVALDWLLNRTNLIPIQVCYIDTKLQLSDWKEFHTWWGKQASAFNVSSTDCIKDFSLINCFMTSANPMINHFGYRLIVLKDIQRSTGIKIFFVGWIDIGMLYWNEIMPIWLDHCARISPWLSLGSICSVRYGIKYFNHQIPESESGNIVHTWTCIEWNESESVNCVRLKYVSCTSEILTQTCDFRKYTRSLLIFIGNLQDLMQNQTLE